jgi:hypothetical protein
MVPDASGPGPDSAPQPRFKPVAVAAVTSDEKPYGVRIDSGGHALRGDEPVSHGGGDTGPAPFGLLLAGLGAARRSPCGCMPSASSGRSPALTPS